MKEVSLTAAERADGTRAISRGRAVARGLGRAVAKLDVRGLENVPAEGGLLLAVNHTSFLDGPILYGLTPRPATFYIKAEMFAGPLGWLLPRIGQIPVRRDVPEREPITTALGVLTAGGVVGIFPEGTRSEGGDPGTVNQVRHGIAYLALRSGCPVLPVAFVGTGAVLPKGKKVPRLRQPVTVAFGEPLAMAGSGPAGSRRTVAAAADRIRDALADLVAATAASHQKGTS